MLTQEINFYPKIKLIRPSIRWLNWKFLWLSNLFVICFFILIYFFVLWNVHYLNNQITKLTLQKNELQEKFYNLKSALPKMFFTQDVNQAIAQLKQAIVLETEFLKSIENYTPFSEKLIGLSQIIVPNVWLTDIAIEKGGETIILTGKSTRSSHLQFFIDKISKEKIFKDYSFRANNIESEKKSEKGSFAFTITMTKKMKD